MSSSTPTPPTTSSSSTTNMSSTKQQAPSCSASQQQHGNNAMPTIIMNVPPNSVASASLYHVPNPFQQQQQQQQTPQPVAAAWPPGVVVAGGHQPMMAQAAVAVGQLPNYAAFLPGQQQQQQQPQQAAAFYQYMQTVQQQQEQNRVEATVQQQQFQQVQKQHPEKIPSATPQLENATPQQNLQVLQQSFKDAYGEVPLGVPLFEEQVVCKKEDSPPAAAESNGSNHKRFFLDTRVSFRGDDVGFNFNSSKDDEMDIWGAFRDLVQEDEDEFKPPSVSSALSSCGGDDMPPSFLPETAQASPDYAPVTLQPEAGPNQVNSQPPAAAPSQVASQPTPVTALQPPAPANNNNQGSTQPPPSAPSQVTAQPPQAPASQPSAPLPMPPLYSSSLWQQQQMAGLQALPQQPVTSVSYPQQNGAGGVPASSHVQYFRAAAQQHAPPTTGSSGTPPQAAFKPCSTQPPNGAAAPGLYAQSIQAMQQQQQQPPSQPPAPGASAAAATVSSMPTDTNEMALSNSKVPGLYAQSFQAMQQQRPATGTSTATLTSGSVPKQQPSTSPVPAFYGQAYNVMQQQQPAAAPPFAQSFPTAQQQQQQQAATRQSAPANAQPQLARAPAAVYQQAQQYMQLAMANQVANATAAQSMQQQQHQNPPITAPESFLQQAQPAPNPAPSPGGAPSVVASNPAAAAPRPSCVHSMHQQQQNMQHPGTASAPAMASPVASMPTASEPPVMSSSPVVSLPCTTPAVSFPVASVPSTKESPKVRPVRAASGTVSAKHKKNATKKLTPVGGGQVHKTVAPQEDKGSPDALVLALLHQRGYPTTKVSCVDSGYQQKPTPLQLASFGTEFVKAIHTSDMALLKSLLDCGISPNPCNAFGDSILDTVCKRSMYEAFQVLVVQHGCNVQVCDGFGRTPLHHAAWAGTFCEALAHEILRLDPLQVLVQDKHGRTPMQYVRKEKWNEWIAFLDKKKDTYWPLGGPYRPFPRERKQDDDASLQDISCDLAKMLVSGEVSPQEVMAMDAETRRSFKGNVPEKASGIFNF